MESPRQFRLIVRRILLTITPMMCLTTLPAAAQQLLPDIVPWVREDAPYLVDWDITNGNLRMQTMFANIGDGLFEIRTDNAGTGGDRTDVTQRIFSGVDNGPNYQDHFVETAVNFHQAHGHIHLENFSEFQLLQAVIEPSGIIDVGSLAASEVKTSFHISDSARIPDPMYANAVSYPSANTGLYQNISVGFGDVYSQGTEGQSISLAGVPSGPLYWLRQVVDPDNLFLEKDYTNNSFEILIDLNHPGQAIRHFDNSFVRPGDLAPPVPGDLTADRIVNIQDWIAFKADAQTDLAGLTDEQAFLRGDFNLDRKHTIGDVLLFRQYFDAAQGAGAFAAISQAPEPSTLLLAALALFCFVVVRSPRGGRKLRALSIVVSSVCCGVVVREAAADQTLYQQDFEGLPLGPNVDETVVNAHAWTDTPPTGWSVNDSGVPFVSSSTRGVTEWKGWSFTDKAWWTTIAGDQGRSGFTLGQGTVAVADPDEWDDKGAPITGTPFGGYYNAFLTTPAISLAGAAANSVKLTFASSWLPECCDDGPSHSNNQTATIRASYNGGASFLQVLRWESNLSSPSYKAGATNESVLLDLNNPTGASSVVLEFGLTNAGNDWWWAIDNLKVFTPTVLQVNTNTGQMSIVRATGITGYEINSAAGSLNHLGWRSGNLDKQNFGPPTALTADYNNDNVVDAADYTVWRDALGQSAAGDADGNAQTDQLDYVAWKQQFGQSIAPGNSWETLIGSNKQLLEFYLTGSSTFASRSIGAGYNPSIDARDLSFTYTSSDGRQLTGIVQYVTGAGAAAVPEPTTLTLLILAASRLCLRRGRAA